MYRKEILAKLQVKKAGSLKKLSQKGIDLLLDKIEAKVTTEDEIDSTIDDLDTSIISFDDVVELIQKETSRNARSVRTNIEKEFDLVRKKKTEDDDDDDDDNPTPKSKSGQPADISKMIADAVTAAMAPFAASNQQIQINETRSKLKVAAKAKGIPEDWADDVTIGEGFNIDEAVTKLDTKWTAAKQLAVNDAIGTGAVLRGSAVTETAFAEASKKYGETVAPKDSGINIQEM
jgi:hypothetical protein